ncbi:signal peptidase II [Tissierella sp.]|uniref:signal peptidase II n=1 Tax=Tissierella sp. TaxID=41274 RepID=UPI0028A8EFBE|nr:signal peptidase II [Tissierella sp.]
MIFILSAFIILLDQFSKYAAINHLKESASYVIIPNFFRLTYVENFGAAFGILQNKKVFFIIITCAVILSLILFLTKNYYRINIFMRIGLGMLLGGTIGNFIDRIRFGYVVDFFSFRLFNRYEFPVFNIADIAIVVGTSLILILVLFDRYEV